MVKRVRSRAPLRRRVKSRFTTRTAARRRLGMRRSRLNRPMKYLFSRWMSGIQNSARYNVSGMTYDGTTSIVSSNGATTQGCLCMAFSFDDIIAKTDFTTLFDQFKINRVVVQIKMLPCPESTNAGQVSATNLGTWYPTIWYAADYDDIATVSLSDIKEFGNVKHRVLRPNKEINISISPVTLQQIYQTSVSTGYACNFKKPYLDMANTAIPHYGLKMVFDYEGLTLAAPNNIFQFKVNCKYYFSCKNTR